MSPYHLLKLVLGSLLTVIVGINCSMVGPSAGTETGNPAVMAMAKESFATLTVENYWHPTSYLSPTTNISSMKKALSQPETLSIGDSLLVVTDTLYWTDTTFSHTPLFETDTQVITSFRVDTINNGSYRTIDSLFSLDTIVVVHDIGLTDTMYAPFVKKTIRVFSQCSGFWGNFAEIDTMIISNGEKYESRHIEYNPCSNTIKISSDSLRLLLVTKSVQPPIKLSTIIYINPVYNNFNSRIKIFGSIVVEKIKFDLTDSLFSLYQYYPEANSERLTMSNYFKIDPGMQLSSSNDDILFSIRRKVTYRHGALKELDCILTFDPTMIVKGNLAPQRAISNISLTDSTGNIGTFKGTIDLLSGIHGKYFFGSDSSQIDIDTLFQLKREPLK